MIYKRKEAVPKPWVCRLERGFDANGKRLYRCKSFRTQGEAKKWQTKQENEKLETGTFIEPSQQRLAEYLTGYLAGRMNLRPRTLAGYRQLLTRYVLRSELAGLPLARLTTALLEQHYVRLGDQGLSPRTRRLVHSILSSALKKAVRDGLIRSNPAAGAELPKQQRQEMQALGGVQVQRLLAASDVTGNRWHALWSLLVNTGLRPSEALALRWSDVSEGRVYVRGSLVREGGGWTVTAPKTERSRRSVGLPPATVMALRDHRREQLKERLAAGPAYRSEDFVFAGQTGQPLDLRNIAARHFKPLLAAFYPLPDLRVYDLRHTFATNMLAEGVSPLTVAKMMGHASAVMVLTVYGHVLEGQEEEATAKVGARFAPAREA